MTNLKEDAMYWYKDGKLVEVEVEIFATLDRPININEIFKEKERLQSQLSECKIAAEQRMETIDKLRSNPPLTFQDLKENMYVWDNKRKCYHKIAFTVSEGEYINIVINDCSLEYEKVICLGRFEENRFYRKEVKQND